MDLYEILMIPIDANNDIIKKAYRKLAKEHHPDKGGDAKKFHQINYAYNILINENTRLQYDNLKKPAKSKLVTFLQDWFNKQPNYKNIFNISDKLLEKIINNIEIYDFNDILGLFSKMIIPNKKNIQIDCSDTETPYWDSNNAEYYKYNELPIKYHSYNSNNIKIELKCTLDDIKNNNERKIKIKRKQNDIFIETYFYFICSHPYIIFNNGGDNNGHLIINLVLPDKYKWYSDNIYYNIDINLYQFIYGLDVEEYNIKNWIPYKDGNIINIMYINNYIFGLKVNVIYNDNINNRNALKNLN
jgi:curved DNA-binding protein CbpA